MDEGEVTIAVFGATGTGKTTFINVASGSGLPVGSGLQSSTSEIEEVGPFYLAGRPVKLVDTPGFDDTTKSDTDILYMISNYLSTRYKEGKKLAGLIYFHRISDFRVGGVSRRNFKVFRQICGQDALANVILLTNMWGQVTEEVGAAREAELANEDIYFKPALDKGARMMRHDATIDSAHHILRQIINNHPLPLLIQQEIVDEDKAVDGTSAAVEVRNVMLLEERERFNEEMAKLQKQTEDDMKARHEEQQRLIREETERHEKEIQEAEARSRALAEEAERHRQDAERRQEEAAEKARQDAERMAEEHRRQAEELQRQIAEQEEEVQRLQRAEEELRSRDHGGGGCRIF
ncbi:hypothetical protein D9613_007526 [Agrocybe pediades]|uniref:G domain-containing protein n=1 Tax=Agrocybe pediades TaxID=84607 RepID=A0A8H4VL11_9AGAR|nr:hypothetical protein D9613_007526 [Agrocybe pediades]